MTGLTTQGCGLRVADKLESDARHLERVRETCLSPLQVWISFPLAPTVYEAATKLTLCASRWESSFKIPAPEGRPILAQRFQRLLRNSLCVRVGGKAAPKSQPRRGDRY